MPDQNQNQNQAAAQPQSAPSQVVDITDPKVLMGMLANMFQSQAESNEINRKLLQIKEREEEARLKKDEDALAKWQRAREAALSELKNFDKNRRTRWERCTHEDQKHGSTIWPISNYPDGRLRGYCTQCTMPIEPEHYEYDANGKATKVPEHPLYKKVLQRDNDIYSSFLPVMTY